MALFIFEHNLPFIIADHLTKLCQRSFCNCEVASNIMLGRIKANAIIKNVVGKNQFFTLCDLLKKKQVLPVRR